MMRPVLALGGALLLGACTLPPHDRYYGWSMVEEDDDDDVEIVTSGNPDVDFLRAMIAHQQEGTAMAAEAASETQNPQLRNLARRLERQGRRDTARMEALERRLAP
ncbi:DUF305 domain-containing protein [Sabulicella glaciei]|uniref:DUF305 domain-containing protein n=1 Tax=Sabulicella glaciei TaxID=2984948 RepID=A0ABT3NWX2_9PROT|nr:DUF305 domain-containing protein [Roseococcus sp. MDT2-1-1]MCW8086673.1 DUF305 domain-containing protein [Roseococcus sp. MDT2-1-1]